MAYKVQTTTNGREYTAVMEKETAELCVEAFEKSGVWESVSLSEEQAERKE